MVMPPAQTEMTCFEGSAEPRRGWVGHHGHDTQPAPYIEFRSPASPVYWKHSTVSAVLLVPFTGARVPDYRVIRTRGGDNRHLHSLELALPDGSRDSITWTRRLDVPIEDEPDLVTDATFVWLRTDPNGEPTKCFLTNGSYLNHNGRKLFENESQQTQLISLSRKP